MSLKRQTPLKLARQSAGYSQAQMAESLGVSERTYIRWENERNPADLTYFSLTQIAQILDCQPEALLSRASDAIAAN